MKSDTALLDDRGYFLCAHNAAATADQQWVERTALEVMDLAVVRAARERSNSYWRQALEPDWDPVTRDMFDAAMTEYAFNFVLKAVCSDASYPRIGQDFLPPHDGFGQAVPGARMGGDNPDNIYRLIAIEHGAAYELIGRAASDAPVNVSYTLVADYGTTETIATIEDHQLHYDPYGTFRITVDAEPAAGRPNHLQTQPGTQFLFIRDTLGDWATQAANRLRVRRITPPARDPLSLEEFAARAARQMFQNVPLHYWYQRIAQFPVNAMKPVNHSSGYGGLITQAISYGGFRLGADEAMIVTARPGGARYHSIVAYDLHFRTVAADRRATSYNAGQVHADADGSTTYVFAQRDPGLANWVDLAGLAKSIILLRWQALPAEEARPGVDARQVKLADLERLLPQARSVTAAQRGRELELRQRSYARRLTVI